MYLPAACQVHERRLNEDFLLIIMRELLQRWVGGWVRVCLGGCVCV